MSPDLCSDLLGRRRVGPFAVVGTTEVVDDDLGTFGREQQRVLSTDAPSGSGDDRDSSLE
jgi:hypothetical protein